MNFLVGVVLVGLFIHSSTADFVFNYTNGNRSFRFHDDCVDEVNGTEAFSPCYAKYVIDYIPANIISSTWYCTVKNEKSQHLLLSFDYPIYNPSTYTIFTYVDGNKFFEFKVVNQDQNPDYHILRTAIQDPASAIKCISTGAHFEFNTDELTTKIALFFSRWISIVVRKITSWYHGE